MGGLGRRYEALGSREECGYERRYERTSVDMGRCRRYGWNPRRESAIAMKRVRLCDGGRAPTAQRHARSLMQAMRRSVSAVRATVAVVANDQAPAHTVSGRCQRGPQVGDRPRPKRSAPRTRSVQAALAAPLEFGCRKFAHGEIGGDRRWRVAPPLIYVPRRPGWRVTLYLIYAGIAHGRGSPTVTSRDPLPSPDVI